MGIMFEFLKAYNGDCILISTAEGTNIVIDGGTKKTYFTVLKIKIEALRNNNEKIDLVVLTHIDSDHIGGLIKMLENEKELLEKNEISESIIKKVWFNAFENRMFSDNFSNETSYQEYKTFKEFISKLDEFIKYDEYISIDNKIEYELNNEIKLKLLSPDDEKLNKLYKRNKEKIEEDYYTSYSKDSDMLIEDLIKLPFQKDNSEPNGASIAFVLEYEKKEYLFLGDAHIDFIVKVLKNRGYTKKEPLELEFIKLSHHGSKKNINQDFLDLVKSDNFIILTSGGSHGHPDKEALARIILNPNRNFARKLNFICNYENILEHNGFSHEDEEKYNFEMIYKNKMTIGDFNE